MPVDLRITSRRRLCLATACSVQFLGILDTLVVSVALPATARDLGIGITGIQWVITAYTISFAGTVLLAGRVADLVGQRRALLGALALLASGAVICGIAGHPLALFTGRALQGLGAAVAMPASVALITANFTDGAARHRALGAWGASGGAALIVGGLLGGALTTHLGWRAVFWFMLPLFASTGYLAHRAAVDRPRRANRRVNLLGAASLALGVGALVYATTTGQQAGWTAPDTVLGYAAACGLAAVFLISERRSEAPLVRPGLFALANVRASSILAMLFPAAFLAPLFLGSLLLQDGFGFDAFTASLALLPFSVAVVFGTTLAPRMMARFGGRRTAIWGFGLAAAGLLLLMNWKTSGYGLVTLPGFALTGAGAALASVPLAAASVSQVAPHEAGMATGLFATSQQAGNALVTAVLTAVTVSFGGTADPASPGALVAGLAAGFTCAALICLAAMFGAGVLLPDTPRPAPARGPRQLTATSGPADRRLTPALTREE